MRKLYLILLIISLGIQMTVIAQDDGGVSIGKGNADADPSAILELVSDNKGLLIPRLSGGQREGISSPATGLLVYDTDKSSFYYWDGGKWKPVSGIKLTSGTEYPGTASEGDLFFNTDSNSLYVYVSGTWEAVGAKKQILELEETTLTLLEEGKEEGSEVDLSVLFQDLTLEGTKISISNGNTIDLAGVAEDKQTLSLNGSVLSITNGNSVDFSSLLTSGAGDMLKSTYDIDENSKADDADKVNGLTVETAVPTGAVFTDSQALSISGTTLSISGGNSVTLPAGGTGTDSQTLSVSGTTLSISNGNSVTLPTGSGTGDMLQSTYDTDSNNKVDDADKVNGLTVATSVPSGAVFTDDQNAGEVAVTPNSTLGLSSSNVQDALEELQGEITTASSGGMTSVVHDTSLAGNGVTGNELGIADNGVSLAKIADGGTDQVLTTDASGNPQWQNISAIQDGTGSDDQTLTLSSNTLSIENGNSVDLSSYLDNTDAQDLSDVLTKGNDAGGKTITNLVAPTASTDAATKNYVDTQVGSLTDSDKQKIDELSLSGTTLNISLENDGESTKNLDLSALQDGTGTDDQTLTLSSNTLSIEDGNSVDLSSYLDNTDSQDLSDVLTYGNDAGGNTITNLATPSVSTDAATKSYVDAGLSGVEMQGNKNSANGYVGLGSDSKIDQTYLPGMVLSSTYVVDSEATQLAISAQKGDVAIRTDENKTYINTTGTNTSLATDWAELLSPTGLVSSVNAATGAVVLDLANILSQGSDAGGNVISGLTNPANAQDAATKNYVDTQVGSLTDSDKQKIDELSLSGTTLNISLENDGESTKTLDLSVLQDGAGSDDQTISLSSNTLSIEDGNSVDLSSYLDNTDAQDLSDVLTKGNDAGGNTITNLAIPTATTDAATKNYVDTQIGNLTDSDNQTIDVLSLSGTTLNISLSNDGESTKTVDFAALQDGTGSDDQTLGLSSNTLSIEGGNSVDLSGYLDNTDDQDATEVFLSSAYSKPASGGSLVAGETIEAAIGKLEKGLEDATAGGGEENVQVDWSVTDTGSDAYILNKPTLGTAAALDAGTSANNVVQLDADGKLPAVDGSALTNLPSAPVSSVAGRTGDVTLTTTDVAASTDKNYVTDAQLVVLGNTSGTNTGDQDATGVTITDSDDNFTGTTVEAALAELASGSTDDQTISDLSLSGNTLQLTLEGDANGQKTLDLSSVDNQNATEVSLSSAYLKPTSGGALVAGETIEVAIGKLEKGLEDATAGGGEENVQVDWSVTDTGSDAYILNKPTLGTAAALDAGTSANNVVQLDADGKLPAVDGSALTNLPAAPVSSVAGRTGDVTLTTADVAASTDKNYITDAQLVVLGNTSGTNTGDQDATGVTITDSDDNFTGTTVEAALAELASGSTDDQTISDLSLSGNTLQLTLEGDANGQKTLDLSSVDNQNATEVSLSSAYSKPASGGALVAGETIEVAIGKLEKGLEDATAGGGEENVQVDWSVTDTGSDAYILNKPTLGTAAALDAGTSANNVVQLDADGKLPAVDGSALTNLPAAPVTSVNTKTGDVTLAKGDVGLGNVDNTSDTDKPVSTATQTALDAKADKSNVLELDNTTAFTPDADYEPATKKYVDDAVGAGGDMKKATYDTNDDGTVETALNATNFTGNLSGDVTGTQGTTSIAALQGKTVDAGSPSSGNVLMYDGDNSKWVPGTVSTTDELVKVGSAGTAKVLNETDFDGSGTDIVIKDGAITSAKILNGEIVNDDIKSDAAIAGTKISPDFGDQAITTTGTLNADGAVTLGATGVATTVAGTLDVDETANLKGNVTLGDASTDVVTVTGGLVFDETTNDLNLSVTDQTVGTGTLTVPDLAGATETIALLSDISGSNALTQGSVYVGNASNTKTELDASGDGKILIGNGTTVASQSVSGDVTITNSGETSIGASKVLTGMIADGAVENSDLAADAVTTDKITDGTIVSEDLKGTPATDPSLGNNSGTYVLTSTYDGGFTWTDITSGVPTDAANIALATGSILVGGGDGKASALDAKTDGQILIGNGTTVASQDVTGDIDIDKDGLTSISSGVIVDADVKSDAAIAGTKISPDFGDQAITTTGTLNADGAVTLAASGVATTVAGTLDVDETANLKGNVSLGDASTDVVTVTGGIVFDESTNDLNLSVTDQTVGTGTLTVPDLAGETETIALLSDITGSDALSQGSVYVGNASNTKTELDASGDGKILIGNGTTVASQDVTGDIDIDKDGLTSISSGVIVDADVSASAAIAGTKISPDFGDQAITTTGTLNADGAVTLAASGVATTVAGTLDVDETANLKGNVSLGDASTDVVTVAGGLVFDESTNDLNLSVTDQTVGTGTLTVPDLAGETETIALLSDITDSDVLSQGSVYVGNASNTKTELDASGDGKILIGNGTTVASQDVTGDIDIDKDGLTSISSGVIVDADVKSDAAIAGTKISPDFGDQAITTTGTLNADGAVTLAASGVATTVAGTLDVDETANLKGNVTLGDASTDVVTVTGGIVFDESTNDLSLSVTDQTVGTGTLTVPDLAGETETIALLSDITDSDVLSQGSVYVGNASNTKTELDASGDGKILIGNGTTVASQDVTGDIDIDKDGLTSISSGVIVDADVSASAAIAGTKISPNFGDQTITTTGTLNADGAVTLGASGVATTVAGTLAVDEAANLKGNVTLGDASTDVVTVTGGIVFDESTNDLSLSVTDQTVAGGTLTVPDLAGETETIAFVSDIANSDVLSQGSVYVGNASNTKTELDASGDGKILIGNGTTVASQEMTGDVTITNGGVTSIGAGKVKNAMLDADVVTTGKIATGAVGNTDLATNAVTNDKIADDAVTVVEIGTAGVSDASKVLTTDISGNPQWEDKTIFATTDLTSGKIYVGNTSNDAAEVSMSGDATMDYLGALTIEDGAVEETMLAANAVTTEKIAEGAVRETDIFTDAVTNSKIADDAVTIIEIGTEGVTDADKVLTTDENGDPQWEVRTNFVESELTTGSVWVGSGDVATALDAKASGNILIGNGTTITSQHVSGDVSLSSTGTTSIGTGAVTNTKLGSGAVTTEKIADQNVTLAKIENLGTGKILVGGTSASSAVAMTGDVTIDDSGVTTIGVGAVTTGKILDGTITADDLDDMGAANGEVLQWNTATSTWTPTSISGTFEYQGSWDASTNDPVLTSTVETSGHYYVVSTSGTQDLGSGNITYYDGDWVISNGTEWQKISNTSTITSVFARTGDIEAAYGDYTWALIDKTTSSLDDIADVVSATKTSGNILIANGTEWSSQDIDGDATISNTGALTIADDAVTPAKIASGGNSMVLTTNTSGDPVWISKGSFTTSSLAEGSIFVGSSGGGATAMVAKTAGQILIGDGTTLASKEVTGDVTIASSGETTIGVSKVLTDMIAPGAVENSDLGADAVTTDKIIDGTILIGDLANTDADKVLTTNTSGDPQWESRSNFATSVLSAGNIFVGSDSNVATSVAMSGDVTISSTGETSIGEGKVTGIMLASDAVTTGKIAVGAVENSDLATDAVTTAKIADDAVTIAEIAGDDADKVLTTDASGNPQWESRTNFTTSTLTNGNIFIGNTSNVATSVSVTGDIAISNGGLTSISSGVIVDADVSASAAIVGTKISPDFGDQAITTTGTLNADGAVTLGASGVATTVAGTLAVDEAANLKGNVTLGDASTDVVTVTGGLVFDELTNDLNLSVTDQTVGTGTLTVPDLAGETETIALLSDITDSGELTEGSVYVGDNTNNKSELDASGDGKILIGNGTTVASQDVTGDIDIDKDGLTSISSGVIVDADVSASAAIVGTKISPDFGDQAITTTGTLNADGAVTLGASGVATTVAGTLAVDEAANLKGNVTLGDASTDVVTVAGGIVFDETTNDLNLSVTDQTVGTGTLTVPDLAGETETIALLSDITDSGELTEGSVYVGDNTNNKSELDASGDGKILIGNGTTVASQDVTGDIDIDKDGLTSISSGVIVDADVSASAAIVGTKISPDFGDQAITTTGTLNADGVVTLAASGVATTVAGTLAVDEAANLKGNITLGDASTDVVTVAGGIVFDETTNDLNLSVTDQTVGTGTLTVPDLAGETETIALLSDITDSGELTEGSVYVGDNTNNKSELDASGDGKILIGNGTTVASQDVTGDIDIDKDGLTSISSGVIVDADVSASAAIAGTKISPDFGDQAITTTGTLNADGAVTLGASGVATTVAGTLAVDEAANLKGNITLGDASTDVVTVTGGLVFDESTNDLNLSVTDQTVGTGTLTVPDLAGETETIALLSDITDSGALTEGSVYVGDNTNNKSELDASGDGKILIGNGTTVASQEMTGDVSITNAGITTVEKIQGTTVSSTTPDTDGQVLMYNSTATQWEATVVEAEKVTYDNLVSDLTATNVQAAIDELAEMISATGTVYHGFGSGTDATSVGALTATESSNGVYNISENVSTGSLYTVAVPASWRNPSLFIGGKLASSFLQVAGTVTIDEVEYVVWQTIVEIGADSSTLIALK